MKKIYVIQGHPRSESLCGEIARSYAEGAKKSGAEVEIADLAKFNFDLNLKDGYKSSQPPEADLVKATEWILKADHLVFVFPSWWASMPALLKGFIDRVFLPGVTFKYRSDSPFPEKLLKGKTGRIIITLDAPSWYYRWFNKAPGLHQLKFSTLEFCGVKPVKATLFGNIRKTSKEKIAQIIEEAGTIGKREGK